MGTLFQDLIGHLKYPNIDLMLLQATQNYCIGYIRSIQQQLPILLVR